MLIYCVRKMSGCPHSNHKFLCGGCSQISYCSEACALLHWNTTHQFECVDGGVKRGPPEEDDFKGAVEKMLKAADEAELLEDLRFDKEDQKYDNLNIEELSYLSFAELLKNATSETRKNKLDMAIAQYFSNPTIILLPNISNVLLVITTLIKKTETIFGRKFMNFSDIMRNFEITLDFAKKKLGLSQFNQSQTNIAKIPIKSIFTQYFQYLNFDRAKWIKQAENLHDRINARFMKDATPYRRERLFNVLQTHGITAPTSFFAIDSPLGFVRRIALFLKTYWADMDDKELDNLVTKHIVPFVERFGFSKDLSKAHNFFIRTAFFQRDEWLETMYLKWIKDEYLDSIGPSIFFSSVITTLDSKYLLSRNVRDKATWNEILSILYERLKQKHPEWLK